MPPRRKWPEDYPDLVAEWDREANGALLPEMESAHSETKIAWRCSRAHRWRAPIRGRTTGAAKWKCPYCTGLIAEPEPGRTAADAAPGLAHYSDAVRGLPLSALPADTELKVALWCGDPHHRPREGKLRWMLATLTTPCKSCWVIASRDMIMPGEIIEDESNLPGSDEEERLRGWLIQEGLNLAPEGSAVKLRERFYGYPWARPDFIVRDARVAVEYDSPGYGGGYHTGERADADALKDRLLKDVGWQVIRVRIKPLPPTGANDLLASGLTRGIAARVKAAVAAVSG